MTRMVGILRELWELKNAVKPERMAAALAFFGMFSFVPLLYIALTVASFFLNNSVLVEEVMARIAKILGPETAKLIQSMLANTAQRQSGGSLLASLIGLVVLLYAASRMFTTLEDMLNSIWGNPSPPNQGVLAAIRTQFLAFVLVLAVGLLFVVIIAGSFFVSILGEVIPLQNVTVLLNFLLPFVVALIAFAVIYRVMARVKPDWRSIWIGAFCAALLMIVGKFAFGLYLQFSNINSAFAAASALAVMLLAIYYAALIFLVGAMLIRVVPAARSKDAA